MLFLLFHFLMSTGPSINLMVLVKEDREKYLVSTSTINFCEYL
jgi:hypothetical protein